MATLASARTAEVATPLGPDVLVLGALTGREELGRLSEFVADVISKRPDITPESLLGKTVTFRVSVGNGRHRFYTGLVTRFSQLGDSRGPAGEKARWYSYRLVVHPWLWLLTRRSDCRAYQDLDVKDVGDKVLARYGGTVSKKLTGSYRKKPFCVQYRETDFNFVSRLWEQEGIYYLFKYADGRSDLVLIDGAGGHATSTLLPTVKFHEAGGAKGDDPETIEEFALTGEIQPGKYATTDYDFTKPRTSLLGEKQRKRNHAFDDLDVFDFPGEYALPAEGAVIAQHRLEEFQARYKTFQGSGIARGIEVGAKFKLKGHFNRALDQEYLTVAHSFSLRVNPFSAGGGEATYRMTFTAIEATEPFRSERLTAKPVVQGLQTAIVTGPAGEQVYTDAHGRVRVQFHWDRYAADAASGGADASCWIRVAQGWAGKQWGMMFLPRVGQEVVVDFLEGDPDQPIVVGRLHNANSMPPYTLPDEKFKSTIKTLTEGGGFNEIRFEDKGGNEQIFVHAEKQLDVRVKKDKLEWIGENEHRIVQKDVFEDVKGDRHQAITGNLNEKVDGTASLETGKDLQVKVGMKYGVDSGQEIHLKAGMKLILEAGMQISLKAGANSINLGPAGITIDGTPFTKVNSGGSAGSGSGASPEAPGKAKEADNGQPGRKDEPAHTPAPPPATTYTQQAMVLKAASDAGAPFAAPC